MVCFSVCVKKSSHMTMDQDSGTLLVNINKALVYGCESPHSWKIICI